MTTAVTTPATSPTRASRDRWVTMQIVWTEAMMLFGAAILLVPWVREDLFFWIASGSTDGPAGASPEALDYIRFTSTLLGALTIGLAAGLWWIARIPLRRGEPWAWTATVTTIAAWFVTDSTASILAGYPRNAVSNTLLVALAVPGLVALRPTD